jgi:uncharacterized membrane protein
MSPEDLLLMIVGTVLVMFLPGLAWSYVFFDSWPGSGGSYKSLSVAERVLWSIALSVAIVPLSFFIVNAVVAVPIEPMSIFGFVMGLTILGILTKYAMKAMGRGK